MGKRRRSFIFMTIVLILNHTLAFAGEGATKKAAIPDWVLRTPAGYVAAAELRGPHTWTGRMKFGFFSSRVIC